MFRVNCLTPFLNTEKRLNLDLVRELQQSSKQQDDSTSSTESTTDLTIRPLLLDPLRK